LGVQTIWYWQCRWTLTTLIEGGFLQRNKAKNNGAIRSDQSEARAVQAQQHTKGVTPPPNEAHIDHIVPRSKGGTNSYSNAQVLTRKENLKKGAN
jgi:5-methylcytosine-specific restriction endonuclease McrA